MNFSQALDLVVTVLIEQQQVSGFQIRIAKKERISLITVLNVGCKNRWVQLFKPKSMEFESVVKEAVKRF